MDNSNKELEKLSELRIWLMEWYSDGYAQGEIENTKQLFAEWVEFAEHCNMNSLPEDEKEALVYLFKDVVRIYDEENRRSNKMQGKILEKYKSEICC